MSRSYAKLLDPQTKHAEVWETVEDLWRKHEQTDLGLCLGFRRLYRDNLHRGDSGRARFEDWAEQRFGVPGKLVGLFSWVGGKIEGLPKTLAAMERGDLGYTKVREFVRVRNEVGASPHRERR